MYTGEQIQKYFQRIKYKGTTERTLENLTVLQKGHLYNIPYENLDQMNGIALSLEPQAVYDKIILSNRGGYCFETQGLLCYLLRSLKYDVVQYAGRFMNEPDVIQMRRHRILVVTLGEKRYLCDVGMRAETSRVPLELREGLVQTDGVGEYRFEKDDFYGWLLMQKLPDKEWKPLYAFTEEVQIDDDFVMPSFYCEKHPDSPFNTIMKIAIYTPDSNLNIVDNEYKVYKMGRCVEERTIQNTDEAKKLLMEKFGICVPPYCKVLLRFPKERLEMLTQKAVFVLLQRIQNEVPHDCNTSPVSVSFDIPDSGNKASIISEQSLTDSGKLRLRVAVRKTNDDRLHSNYVFNGTKSETIGCLSKENAVSEFMEYIKNLSESVDKE